METSAAGRRARSAGDGPRPRAFEGDAEETLGLVENATIAAVEPAEIEVGRLRVIASRRAEAANPRWVADVRARKLTIANGVGAVHGAHYDLEAQYGIGLTCADLNAG